MAAASRRAISQKIPAGWRWPTGSALCSCFPSSRPRIITGAASAGTVRATSRGARARFCRSGRWWRPRGASRAMAEGACSWSAFRPVARWRRPALRPIRRCSPPAPWWPGCRSPQPAIWPRQWGEWRMRARTSDLSTGRRWRAPRRPRIPGNTRGCPCGRATRTARSIRPMRGISSRSGAVSRRWAPNRGWTKPATARGTAPARCCGAGVCGGMDDSGHGAWLPGQGRGVCRSLRAGSGHRRDRGDRAVLGAGGLKARLALTGVTVPQIRQLARIWASSGAKPATTRSPRATGWAWNSASLSSTLCAAPSSSRSARRTKGP